MTTALDRRPTGVAGLEPTAPGGPVRAVLVWALAGTAVGIAVATIALHTVNGPSELTDWWYGNLGLTGSLVVPGLLLAARRPHNPIGWLLLVACLGEAVCAASREYLVYGAGGHPAPGWLTLGWLGDSAYLLGVATLPTLLALFPDGRPLGGWRGWGAAPALLPGIALVVGWPGYLTTGDVAHVAGRTIAYPGAGMLPAPLADLSATAGEVLMLVSLIAAVVALLVRSVRSRGEERQQVKWVAWAGSLAIIEVITEFIPGNDAAPFTGVVADLLLVSALAVAILRHRLLDIDLIINRSLLFGILSVLVVGGYVAIVLVADDLFGATNRLGPGLLATAVVAVAFAPVRSGVQRRVDRLLYGARREPYRLLTRLGRSIEADRGGGELAVVVGTVAEALRLPYVALLATDGAVLVATGRPGPDVDSYPLGYQGEAIGTLQICPRSGTRAMSGEDRRLLADLTGHIAAALHAVQLAEALQVSRQHLVAAKEEERRRLRRDLHDGLGPKLAALALKLDAARTMVTDRPGDARDLLGVVKGDIRETIEDIRRLVYGLRPPALDDLGLVGAVRESVQNFDVGGGHRVSIDAPDRLPSLPAAAEVAAYWIVNEAVTNVVRHAGARTCEVVLSLEEDLLVVVRDDGRGLAAGARAGVGTSSMAERAAELGGSLSVTARTDGPGTEVRARIPLAPAWGETA